MHNDLTPEEETLNILLNVRGMYLGRGYNAEREHIDKLVEFYREIKLKENEFLDASEILNDGIENFGIF